jgi:hypothetical protein
LRFGFRGEKALTDGAVEVVAELLLWAQQDQLRFLLEDDKL